MIDLSIDDVFYLCSNIEKSSRFRRKRDRDRDANEWKYCFDDVLSVNENKSLNNEFFEIVNKKTDW